MGSINYYNKNINLKLKIKKLKLIFIKSLCMSTCQFIEKLYNTS